MFKPKLIILAGALALLAAACAGDDDADTALVTGSAASTTQEPIETQTEEPTSTRVPTATPSGPLDTNHVRALFGDWPHTDPQTLTVDPTEILRGCFGKDCIQALDVDGEVTMSSDRPLSANFEPVSEVDMEDRMPIAYITINGQTRGYPLAIMTWHEIVNDNVGGVPVAVTFCPLCNTALSFERTVDGEVLDFGVSGNLRNSDLIMFDRQTESWWQQATGESIVGKKAGTNLRPVATSVVGFGVFKETFPDADMLSTDTGVPAAYGFNPYAGYDTIGSRPFLFQGEIDGRLEGLERVVALRFNDEYLAVPFGALAETLVANVVVGDTPVAVLWAPGTNTALGSQEISRAADIGAAIAHSPVVNDTVLEFEPVGDSGTFTDINTGSVWLVTGIAIEGPLTGTQLEVVEHTTQFWFSWAAFYPDTEIWEAA